MTGPSNPNLPQPLICCTALILLILSTTGCKGASGTEPGTVMTRIASAFQQDRPAQQNTEITEAEKAEMFRHPFKLAAERMSVKAPQGDVPLGNPLKLVLTFASGKLVGPISIIQHNQSGTIEIGSGPAKIISEDGDNKTIEITPAQTGPLDVEIGVLYQDNALAQQAIRLHVVPSAKGLKAFHMNDGGQYMRLCVDCKKSDQERWLRPTVTYQRLPDLIYLDNSAEIKLSIEQEEDNPVISVNKYGVVHALREGKAVVNADFDGVKDHVEFDVVTAADPRPRQADSHPLATGDPSAQP
jgi:hypothetical protein